MAQRFQGPTRPGTDVKKFRATGRSVPSSGGSGGYQGPTRPGTDAEIFRRTGKSVMAGSPEALKLSKSVAQKDAQINKDRTSTINQARNDFNKVRLDRTSSRADRVNALKKFNQDVSLANIEARTRKVQTGIQKEAFSSAVAMSRAKELGIRDKEGRVSEDRLKELGRITKDDTAEILEQIKNTRAGGGAKADVSKQTFLTVEAAPSDLEKLQKEFEKQKGALRGGLIERVGLTTPIAGVAAFKQVITREVSEDFAQIKDSQGNFIFTPKQSEQIGKLGVEVGEGLVLGAVGGKVLTLGRGGTIKAITKVAPKLAESEKARKIAMASEVVLVGGLTVQQANSLRKTFRDQGNEAGVLQLVGLTSFGVGFSKTGIKTSAQSIKEFESFSKIARRTVPKGKRGQAQFQLLKKQVSKSRFDKLKEIRKEFEKKLEKKLSETKTQKERWKIISDISKQIKTKEGKIDLRNYIKSLITEKDLLKIPEFTIISTSKKLSKIKTGQKLVSKPKIKEVRTLQREGKFGGMERELGETRFAKQRQSSKFKQLSKQLSKQQFKQLTKQLSKQQSKQLLITRSKQASQFKQTSKQIQKSKQKLATLQKSKQATKEMQKEKVKLATLQIMRTRQLSKLKTLQRLVTKQASKTKQIQQQKLGGGYRPPPKGTGNQRIDKALAKLKGKSVDVVVGMQIGKERIIARNQAPRRGLKKAIKYTDRNIEASFRLVLNKKKPKKKDIASVNIGEKFRPSKTNALFLVEKRKHRLDSPGEKRQIKSVKKKFRKLFPIKKRSKK